MVLTDFGPWQARISQPGSGLPKSYLAQVEGEVGDNALAALRAGVMLNDGPTLPALAEAVAEPHWMWPRNPPIRFRKTVPTSWLSLTLREGRNRQVRRMTAAVGLPTLRLVRVGVGPWRVEGLAPGEWREVARAEAESVLNAGGRR